MGSHYHVGMVPRLKESGSLDNRLNDVESAKAVGINIFGVIDGARARATAARRSSPRRPSTTTPPGDSRTRRSW